MPTDQISPEELRDLYVKATPKQRYRVALDRIEHPGLGPSLLVNVMSALEGFARTVAVHTLVTRGGAVESAYARLRDVGPVALLAEHVCPAYRTTPDAAFGSDAWGKLPDAVKFRNLLIHEATYLDGGTCDSLIKAARHVLTRLGEMAGVA